MSYSARFIRFDALTAELEGGLASNAADRGGETAFGVSRRSYPAEEPWPPSRERAEYLRHRDYWTPCRCDELPELIALAVYDWAIHSGEGAAARALQRELGVTADGDIGPRTVAACVARCSTPEHELELAEALMRARARMLSEIVRGDQTQAEFLGGWLARLLTVGAAIRDAYLVALDSRPIEPLKGGEMTATGPIAGGEAPREASSPLQGIVRQVVRVPIAMLLGWLATSLPSLVSADAVPGLTDTVTLSVSGVILAALAGLGKLARDRGWPVLGSLL